MFLKTGLAQLCCAFALSLVTFLSASTADACGRKSDCEISLGDYRIFLPDDIPAGKKVPAIIHIHGLGRSSEITMNNGSFRRVAKKLGVALIAANGSSQAWTFPNGVKRGRVRDDFAYFRQLVADVTKRFPIDKNKVVLSGFSIGASMVWYLACQEPRNYAGFIPVAGTMWRPQPSRCSAPIGDLHHYHGTDDPTFPLEGRRVHGKRQGAIADTFETMFRQDRCTRKVVEETKKRGLRCKHYRNCGGEALRFCLHGGSHVVKAFYLEDGFRRIAEARGWQLPR